MSFRGLTWDHPRGRNALAAAAGPITWAVQPLEGFESAPIAENCAAYDLVVLDHPHLGEALAANCLLPLDEVFAPADLDAIAARTVGPCLDSYRMAGRLWALPLDAATQVQVHRPDLIAAPPRDWDDLQTYARDGGRVALSLAGPHAFLSFLSVVQAIDPALDLRDGDVWMPDAVAERALGVLAGLARGTPAAVRGLNPIGLLEFMGRHEAVAICPLVYGYVNYAHRARPRPLVFNDAPGIDGGPPGTILGGTGIALSRRCTVTDDLRDHLLWLMSAETQSGFIPDHDGQPSSRAAWDDPAVNAPVGDFYRRSLRSLDAASIRPRHDGYIAFQTQASALLRRGFSDRLSEERLARDLARLFARSHETRLEETER